MKNLTFSSLEPIAIARAVHKAGFLLSPSQLQSLLSALDLPLLINQEPQCRVRTVLPGRRMYKLSREGLYCDFLRSIGCHYIIGNDAPRKGKLGDYIAFNKTDFIDAFLQATGVDLAALVVGLQQQEDPNLADYLAYQATRKATIEELIAKIEIDGRFYTEILAIEKKRLAKRLSANMAFKARTVAFQLLLDRQGFSKIDFFWDVRKAIINKVIIPL